MPLSHSMMCCNTLVLLCCVTSCVGEEGNRRHLPEYNESAARLSSVMMNMGIFSKSFTQRAGHRPSYDDLRPWISRLEDTGIHVVRVSWVGSVLRVEARAEGRDLEESIDVDKIDL